ncbi:MAG: tetratricopeptide repeat protein [Deltaproteobacteria bacterium]|nr:tetratricopeptide repeat protein [Deltaproteobacteria bacterium]
MKQRGFAWLLLFVFVISLLSCAANMEKKRAQSKATRQLGEAYMRQGDYTAALRELLKAESLSPGDHLVQNDLGLIYMSKFRYDLAETHFKKAIQIKPDYAAAKNNLGTVYLATKDWHSAIKTFKPLEGNLLYATPHYPLSNLGLAYYSLGNYPMAEEYYLRALDIEPNFIIALRGLGRTYIALVKIPQAVSVLERAAREAPAWPELYMDMGEAYKLAGQYTKALLAYNKVSDLAPNSEIAEQAKAEISKMQP